MKRIAVLTTSGTVPTLIQSVYQDGELTFGEAEKLKPQRLLLAAAARLKLPKLVKRGDTVLVDEYSGTIAKAVGAKQVTLATKGANDVPVIVAAFGLYWEMERQHAILYPASNPSAYKVPKTLVNEVHNARGEMSYQVDWENIRTEHYLMLLTVYATTFNDVGSAAYIQQMMDGKVKEAVMTKPFETIIAHQDAKDAEVIGQSLAGKRLNDHEWVL